MWNGRVGRALGYVMRYMFVCSVEALMAYHVCDIRYKVDREDGRLHDEVQCRTLHRTYLGACRLVSYLRQVNVETIAWHCLLYTPAY
jgi:hypothetical protein